MSQVDAARYTLYRDQQQKKQQEIDATSSSRLSTAPSIKEKEKIETALDDNIIEQIMQ